jgi:DNA-binding beta-propeller fold protein YncE
VACTNFRADQTYGEGRLDVVDLVRWRVIRSVPVGRNPQDVLVAPDGRVHVLCTGTYGTGPDPEEGSVHVVDAGSLTVVATVALGGSPGRIALDGSGTVWVAGYAGGVRRYDGGTLEVLPDPADPALGRSDFSAVDTDPVTGLVYVTNFAMNLLIEIDPVTLAIERFWSVGDGPVDVLVSRPAAEPVQRGAPQGQRE